MKWQLQTAKAKLSEVIRRARSEGPQIITVHGREEFVLLRREDLDAQIAAGIREGRAAWGEEAKPETGLDLFHPVLGLGVDLMELIGPREYDDRTPLFEGPEWGDEEDDHLPNPEKP
jgi:prevent-host-death family protein